MLFALQRQSAVTTPTLKLRKMPSKYSYWPAKPVSGTIVVILSINTFIGRKIVFVSRQRRCYKTHFQSELNFDKIRSYCTLPLQGSIVTWYLSCCVPWNYYKVKHSLNDLQIHILLFIFFSLNCSTHGPIKVPLKSSRYYRSPLLNV